RGKKGPAAAGRARLFRGYALIENALRVARDHALFVRGDHAHDAGTCVDADDVARGVVRGAIDAHAEVLEAGADSFAHGRRVLADAAGEDERVEPAESRGESADRLARLVREHFDGERGAGVALSALEQRLH